MDIESLRDYCLSKPAAEETLPFGPDTLVYKVGGKIFLICSLNSETFRFSVKCDPEKVIELRERYDCVQPGYHLNKKHWNTILLTGQLPWEEIQGLILHSYNLVVGV
jgi:predicted DNA-binding protein (MmcQ/YjbR family)